jgi:sugar (pentulose or hexulose) kinase
MNCYIGLDFGTSGARLALIDDSAKQLATTHVPFPAIADGTLLWPNALNTLLGAVPPDWRANCRAIAINGTSATVLLCEADGGPVTAPLLYNDDRGAQVLNRVRAIAPLEHLVNSATSSLAKLLWWEAQGLTKSGEMLLHQADWLGFLLHGQIGITDYHNALKLGYDVENLCYPDWLLASSVARLLPEVVPPGTPIAPITPTVQERFGLPADCQVCAGTTDSIAAFIASGATQPGEAVTSLGSTLVLKLLSRVPVRDRATGVYSHRYGDLWLTGGASNTGGAVLKQFFSDVELQQLSDRIDPTQPSELDYYPLLKPGERFPDNDPNLSPRLEPRPTDSVAFLHGLLASMARIEAQGYRLLAAFGADPVTQIYTAGGGAKNEPWRVMRERFIGVPVARSRHTEAAFGTAQLARRQGFLD